jgi:hypothetical protein
MTAIKGRYEATWPGAVARIIAAIGPAAALAIGKSMSLVYQFSNSASGKVPNLDQALALDVAFKRATGDDGPLRDLLNRRYADQTGDVGHVAQAPHQRFLQAMSEVGEISADLHKAFADGRVTPNEVMRLQKDCADAIAQLRRLSKDIEAAAKKGGGA